MMQRRQPYTPNAIEMKGWPLFWQKCKRLMIRLRRKLPYVVWYGDEVDITVTFTENRLSKGASMDGGLEEYKQGILPEVQQKLSEIGIEFDAGLGPSGRDWEWDWSLQGPINLKFRGKAKKPERRAGAHGIQSEIEKRKK